MHGIKDVDDYYSRASCKQFLTAIRVPTLILQALDDPFLPASALPRPADLSPSVTIELADQGGHVGFIAGAVPFKPHFWLEQRILKQLQSAR